MKILIRLYLTICFLLIQTNLLAQRHWEVVVNKDLMNDEAIKVALSELQNTGARFNLKIDLVQAETPEANSIIIGTPSRNGFSAELVEENNIVLNDLEDKQTFQIWSNKFSNTKKILICGGSILGDVYGIFWLVDRLQVHGDIPRINALRNPKLKIRFSGGSSKQQMRSALRLGATWVWGGYSVNDLIQWNSTPEDIQNKKNREELKELISYAHSLHLKFLVYEDEFSYQSVLMEEFNASLNPEDPAFWEAVQTKYRRLFTLLPEIDGIRLRTGESTRVGGKYKAFDVMHEGDSYWNLEHRYQTWVKKIHEVVVGEFDKIYYQRTWVTSSHEQHSISEVYKNIFTEEVPTNNLYLSPYLSTTDRYFFQPYNPTFNLTPHNMIVLLAPLNYHGNNNCGILPTFPGTYFQGGLKTYLDEENNSCVGADFASRPVDVWDTWSLTAYSVYRLTWEPDLDLQKICKDFASINFGKKAAADIAEILLLTPKIYKYGIYIEPEAQGQFSSLTHLRLTTFPVKGLPNLDNGRKHIEFLRKIYLRCRPWINETLLYLDHGLKLAYDAKRLAVNTADKITDHEKRKMLLDNSELTLRFIETNNKYIKAIFAYFQYSELNDKISKERLISISKKLNNSVKRFKELPGFSYRLDGIQQLQKNISEILINTDSAKAILADSPNDEKIDRMIDEQQKMYKNIIEKYSSEAVKILYWQGRIDGRDLLHIREDQIKIEHLRYDPIVEDSLYLYSPLPSKKYTVIPLDIESRSFGPFVLEQPDTKNNFTAAIYLSDSPMHGYSWWKFELYYIPRSPEELGLISPWEN